MGSPYQADLPAFVDPGGKGLRLTASGLPGGMTFRDLGGGKGMIEGVPLEAGSASIQIVATNRHDQTAQMLASFLVGGKTETSSAPVPRLKPPTPPALEKPVETPAQPPVSPSPEFSRSPPDDQAGSATPPPVGTHADPNTPEERAKAFIANFDGGECFLVEPLPGSTKPHDYQAVGRELEPFRRFDSEYKREVGVEANLTVAPITAEQCGRSTSCGSVRQTGESGHA